MSTLFLVVFLGLVGGVAVGLQSPLSSMIAQRTGSMESVFIVHLGGAVFAGTFLLLQRGGNLGQWRSVPWYALCAGALGLVVISAVNHVIPRQGAITLYFLVITGQIVIGALIDHFGLLEVSARPLDPARLVGFVVLAAGVWLVVR